MTGSTIFGFPVTLSLAMPDGEVIVVSDPFEYDGREGVIKIDPARIARIIDHYEAQVWA